MIYFTSDPHYYHGNVIQYCKRPYESVVEMNEALVRNWNSVVRPDDTVYCLGDFSLAIRPVELFSHRLMGSKFLVPGNHDWCHPANKKSRGGKMQKQIDIYERNGWTILPISTTLELGPHTVNVSHMPYGGDNSDERYQNYRMEDDGKWLLCGHVHEKWRQKGRMINCGVDVWNYTPIDSQAIIALIEAGEVSRKC